MNKDQLLSLLRTGLKTLGGALIAHHMTKAGTWLSGDNAIGLASLVLGWWWSHSTHATDTVTLPTKSLGLLMALSFTAAVALPACKAPPQRAIFTAVQAPAVTGEQAIKVWGDYVSSRKAAGNPVPKTQELQVVAAYAKFRAIELAAIDTAHTAANVISGTNSITANLVGAASTPAAQDALAELVGLIKMFGATL